MLIKRRSDIKQSEITDERLFHNRRAFIKTAAAGAIAAVGATVPWLAASGRADAAPISIGRDSAATGDDKLNSWEEITNYNNFYEFGTRKRDPANNAHTLVTRPWTVTVDGEVHKPRVFDIEDILKSFPAEERIYRLRCVEAWSMVIPWLGFPLGDLLKQVEPTSHAEYVELTTLHNPDQMPGQRRAILPWPYVEGLRLDEAMHPLTILSVGLYGKMLPNQNGAPIRLVIPWKYGFKSVKSIVRIRLVRQQPATTWNVVAPREYGFYANVNPEVDHPRWSQKRERRIGEFLKRPTEKYNGYGEQVAQLYTEMDLNKHY